ncbi:hypothetical protein AXG93_285s1240 [Marchantia polymorpha subsp. ruderalis]|uniref:Uncharacterized protein n=1 Tax=Marchantia polymorpha subsp. ruderalis TaxID=1480154 RepID=A0A176VRZ9_MARPO|nr:hypothetical protein AXG93_285s1240 [Marchantia polymorpha subsp. ruderalis]
MDTTDEDERGPGEGIHFERGDSRIGCRTDQRDGGRSRGHYTADILGGRVAVQREWNSATALVREREAQLREKEIECEVLQLNLEKEFGRCVELEETPRGLRISNENAQKVTVDLMARLEKFREAYEAAIKRSKRLITTAKKREKKHVEELATLKARRAEEARIAEELRG